MTSKSPPPVAERPAGSASDASAVGMPRKPLTPAAERALAEAAARRAERDKQAGGRAAESGGRSGPDPVRYGDWEVKGIASDF